MKKLFGAATLIFVLGSPSLLAAQSPAAPAPRQPSPFAALELHRELGLNAQQVAHITVARDSLREAHRVHCAPMHASKPTEAEEARHHAEMAALNARFEGQARAALTAAQLARLAELRPAPAAAEHHDDQHTAHPAPAPAPAKGHTGHPRR